MVKNDNFVIKKSGSSGHGLFAKKDFKRGAKLLEYTGEIITDAEAEDRLGMYLFNLPNNLTIDGSSRTNLARYANHSCFPNAVAYYSGNKRVFLYARRKIVKGEEVTYDYGKEFFDGHIRARGCKCGFCDGKGKVVKKK